MPFITDDPIVTPAGQPFVTEDPLVPQSPEDLAAAWESGQLTDEALTPAQALQLTLEKAKTRQSPTALVRGGLAGTGQLLLQGLETAKELGSYGLKNPPSVAGFGLTKAAAEGALRGSADLGQIGKNVLEGAVFNPYEIVSKAAEKRGWPTALMQAARVMQPSMEVGTPMEKLAKVFPMETAEVARQSMISDRQTAAQRQQLTENKRSLLEELTTAGMADPMGMLPFGERLPDSVRFGASPATAESLGRVMAPAAELGNLTETVGMVADPTMLAAPGASLAAKLGARIAPRMAARLGAREAAGQARQALLEGFEQAAQAAPPSRARFVGGPDLSVRDVGPVPPPVIQPRFTAGPDGTVSFTAPPVIPTTPDLAPLLDAYTGSVRQAAGAPRGMAQAAVGRAGRIAEQVGGAVSRAAESMGDLADRYRTALGVISAAAGAVKGPLGVLAGSQVPKVVSTAAKWAKEASRAGAALRTIAATDWKSSVPVWRQIAKDPSAPQWLVRGVTAPVVGRLTVGKLAETAIRGGGRIAAGAAEGAATDALFAAADPEMGGEQIGGEAGPGGLIGFLSTSATARGAARQQKADAVAYDAMRIAARSIDAGANPLAVARASDRLMQTAAVMETLFRGSLTGQRGIKVDLMDADQFAQVAGSPTEAAFFDPQTGRVVVNLETIDADGRQLHEVSHALMQSAAASNPAIVEHFRGLLGPDGLARARQDYQQALGRQIPQDDAYIVGELFAESVANTLRGVDLSEGVPAAIGDTRAVSFFRDADVRKALRDASTQELVRQQVDALTSFRPAVDLEREPGVRLDPAMAGKHPAFPVEPQANGTTGNDFVQQTPDGRTVATPPAQVRSRVRNRRREVLELFPDTEPIPDNGPTAPPVPEVAVRRTPAGLVQKTGTRLGEQFYATARSFGEGTKNMLRRVEQAIAGGETMSGWYQQVGQSDNWAASVRESLGAIEAQFKDFIPYAFKIDKQGNLLVENYSLTALERKANQWAARQGPLSLELWNGDIAAFRQDVQTYLNNHSEGRPGADGIGDGKRNLINVFLVGGNRTFEALNPLRAQARGKDRQGIVRSYRADRLQTVEPSEVQGFTQPNYGKQVRNMSPKADKAFWEADARQFSPQVRGEPVAFTPPQKTVKAYKLFRTLKSRPGELFPLFVGKNESVPVGEWMPAKFIPTKGFAERPGWHAGVLPNAPHLLSKDGTMAPDRVWAEVEIPADADWQSRADATPTGDIKSEVPAGGYYTFKRPGLQGGSWIIGGALKVNRILSQPEVDKIMSEAGANKAAPVSGDVRRSSPQIKQGEPGFFSKLEKVVLTEMKGASMPAAQLKAVLRNRGVKAEEMKLTSAEYFIDQLAEENGGKVPKDQLLQKLYSQRSPMEMQSGGDTAKWEVSNGGFSELFDSEQEALSAKNSWASNLADIMEDDYRAEEDADGGWRIVDRFGEPTEISTDSGRRLVRRDRIFKDEDTARLNLREALEEIAGIEILVQQTKKEGPQFEEFTLPGGENYRELALVDPAAVRWEGGRGHDFDPSGRGEISRADIDRRRVAHMRIKDRTDADGREGLFIEEIQSDRHQAGRRYGYSNDPEATKGRSELQRATIAFEEARRVWLPAHEAVEAASRARIARAKEVLTPFYQQLGVQDLSGLLVLSKTSPEAADLRQRRSSIVEGDLLYQQLSDAEDRAKETADALEITMQKAETERQAVEKSLGKRVPEAPFRKDWPLQMFKRALRDAVDSGKEWIGWTDGETQASRYDLSRSISSFEYHPETKELYAYDLSGSDVFGGGKTLSDTELVDTIGKDAAEKLLAQPTDSDGAKRLEGPALKLGGEGMKGFYDQMLPKEVGKYVKQWGAKVEQTEIPLSVEADVMNGEEGGEDVVNIWKVDITPDMAESIKTQGQERFSPRIEQSVLDLDKLGNKDLPQVNAKTIPYPANPTYPTSIALPARWGLVNRNIVGMPRSQAEVRGIVDRQVERLAKVVEENPTFAKESARFYLDMAESSMLMADSAFPESYGKEKWRAAELMLRFLALGSPRTGVSANATKSSYSASAAASNFTAGFKVGFGSQQTGAKNTFSAWKKGLPFDMSGEGVDNKVRNFYMNGLAELLDLARNEGDLEAIDYLMDSAAAGLELTKPGEKVASEKHPEVQRLLDGMATVDMWDMAAKGYAWPGWISNKKVRPGEGKVPWVWTEEKYATKSTLKSPAWSRIAKELSQKKRVVRSPADLRYQEARALRIEGNKDWDATTWAERIKQPFDPDTELTTFSNVSEEGLSPGGAGPLYDAQQTIDGLIADEINSRGMAPLFGKEKLLARNAQEILWALERLDNPIEANNDLALFGNTFKGLANEINRLRTDEYGPVASRPKPDDRGSTVLAAMESAYAKLANQDMPLEVVSAGTSPEARTIQDTIQRLRDSGVQQPEIAATQAVADGLHEFLTEAADRHGVDVTVDSVSVGNGGYTENGAPSVNPNMVMRLRGSPTETRNLLEILSRALDQDGGNIFRRPTIRELNTPTTKFNTVVTFKTEGMTTEQKTAFFMDLNGLKDSDGNSFFTGFTETADGMAIGDQFYGGDMAAQVDAKRLEILRILRKHKVADFWADSVIIETVSRNSPEPEGLRQQPFAAEIMDEVQRRLKSAAGNAPTFPQMLDEPNRAVRRLETGKTKEFSGKTALTRYFVEARSAVDAAMLRGIMDEAMGEQLKETLTEVEKQREPEVKAQAAQKAKERADAKALEARRKARLKAMKERRKATE